MELLQSICWTVRRRNNLTESWCREFPSVQRVSMRRLCYAKCAFTYSYCWSIIYLFKCSSAQANHKTQHDWLYSHEIWKWIVLIWSDPLSVTFQVFPASSDVKNTEWWKTVTTTNLYNQDRAKIRKSALSVKVLFLTKEEIRVPQCKKILNYR